MKAVLDTNVLIAATLIRGGNEAKVLRAWRSGAFELVISPPILDEFARALAYPKIRRVSGLSEQEVISLVEDLARASFLVLGDLSVKACRDPDDDKFLAAGLQGEADYVVSGDKDLLALQEFRGVTIVTPRVFLQILRGAE